MSSLRHVEHCISRQLAHQKLNAFISLPNAATLEAAARDADIGETVSSLNGWLISLKDNITTSTEPTSCASRALTGYTAPYDSVVASLLKESGAILCGKTNMDEFGMGSHSQSPFTGRVQSPFRSRNAAGQLSTGGSSGGAAVSVATGQVHAAIGTDTGGSVRLPAAWTGTVGFKPSYGRISRWGVVDYANSLDTVGIISRCVRHAQDVFSVLDKADAKDATCLSAMSRERVTAAVKAATRFREARRGKLRIGVPLDYNVAGLQQEVKTAWMLLLGKLQDAGHEIVPISLGSTPLALGAYYILAPAEASSNLAKYDGVRYGHRADGADETIALPVPATDSDKQGSVLFARTRGEAFGAEVRRRILLGTYTLSSSAMDNYFLQAQRVRRLIQQEYNGVFAMQHPLLDRSTSQAVASTVDILVAPTAPTLPPSLEQIAAQSAVERYVGDALTVPASLAGLPALNVPIPTAAARPQDKLATQDGPWEVDTVGMQVIGQYGDDDCVLEAGALVESLYNE